MQSPKQQRRMTAPASSLQPPEGGYQPTGRPPSPLRNTYLPNTFTGIDPQSSGSGDENDDRDEWARSPSPTSSVSQMAASFARSVGNLVNNMTPRSPSTMPTDLELETEAARERDRSRRLAEDILTREAQERRLVEERVLAMMENTKNLPPPPSRSQSLDPPSPSSSQKEAGGWWAAAKNRLTPTKDLTPAQQVIQEAKAREKDKKNGKGKEKEWPANPQSKYTNPTFTNLVPPPQRRPVPDPSTPISPTPSRPHISNANMPPNLTPSPMRYESSTSSPREREKDVPPLYAHFDETTGTLDVHVTLLTIAKRFEKLEKWTVGHVRALEERMGDVERWLVDKENEKEQSLHESSKNTEEGSEGLSEIREGLQELQSRVSSLGREMAKLATAPSNLSSSAQARYPAEISAAPLTPSSSFAIPGASPRSVSGYTARESTSPPMASSASATGSTRLPYPTGDYASPPDSKIISQDVFAASPSSSKQQPVSGLPDTDAGVGPLPASISSTSTSYSNASFSSASSMSSGLPGKGNDLSLPKASPRAGGRGSVSPTPRKRYTVALGGSVESDSESGPELGTATFSSSEEGEDFGGDTIGKSAAARLSRNTNISGKADVFSTPTATAKEPRMRAQSAYGLSSILQASPTTTPLGSSRPGPPHGRSRSIDRFGTGNFVDPLVLRKQSGGGGKEAGKPVGNGKVPVGQLVAFFDGDRK